MTISSEVFSNGWEKTGGGPILQAAGVHITCYSLDLAIDCDIFINNIWLQYFRIKNLTAIFSPDFRPADCHAPQVIWLQAQRLQFCPAIIRIDCQSIWYFLYSMFITSSLNLAVINLFPWYVSKIIMKYSYKRSEKWPIKKVSANQLVKFFNKSSLSNSV